MSCAGNCYRANVSSYQLYEGCTGPAGRRGGWLAVLVCGVRKRKALLLSLLRMLRS